MKIKNFLNPSPRQDIYSLAGDAFRDAPKPSRPSSPLTSRNMPSAIGASRSSLTGDHSPSHLVSRSVHGNSSSVLPNGNTSDEGLEGKNRLTNIQSEKSLFRISEEGKKSLSDQIPLRMDKVYNNSGVNT